jgi:uncharacterized protein YcfJ
MPLRDPARWGDTMNIPSFRLLATALVAATAFSGAAAAQTYGSYPGTYGSYPDAAPAAAGDEYDYARVIRVDPIIGAGSVQSERCYENTTPVYGGGDRGYRNDGYYGEDGYRRDDGYARGSETGRTLSTVLGSLAGAVLGSKIGGGSGSMIGTVVGSTVGGIAGRSVYENSQQRRVQQGSARYCDPVPVRSGSDAYGREDERVVGYNVTYEYAGRVRTTRTDHHPGDRIRVRVMAE